MNWIWPIVVSMAPFFELRAGIPIALAMGISPLVAFLISVGANMLVPPIMFFFLEFVHHRFMHIKSYNSLFDRFMARSRKKTHKWVEKYGVVGLAIITAIPLPGTGAYTATLVGWFLGMNRMKIWLAVAVGVIGAGSIMIGLSLGFLAIIVQ